MIVLHALWRNSTSGRLCLWAESSTPFTNSKLPGKHSGETQLHPFALGSGPLEQLILELANGTIGQTTRLERLSLLLPSNSKQPLPSPELVQTDKVLPAKKIKLSPWAIDSFALEAGEALDFLISLPVSLPTGIAYGSSLRFWVEVAKLSLELIARQRFIPTIKEDKQNSSMSLRAVWEAFIDEEDTKRMQLLSNAIPPVCRAQAEPKTKEDQPFYLVSGFINRTVDAFVRGNLRSASPLRPRRSRNVTLPERWLKALSSEDPKIEATALELASFSTELKNWLSQIQPAGGITPFRTCFRLDPPGDGTSEWKVSFHLQANDDPSLLVPAEKVWGTRSGAVTFLKRRFENPQERLLADLGKASRVFPAIEEGLKVARPARVRLSTERAYSFLRESAPLLSQSGFGVLLPPWWQKPAARLSARLSLKPKTDKGVGSGLIGMDSLVDYDWKIALGDEILSPEEFKRLAELKVPMVRVRGEWVELRPEEIETAIAFFKKKNSTEMRLGEALRAGIGREISETGLPVTGVESEGWIKGLLDKFSSGSRISEIRPPAAFHGSLRPYQVRGLSWLAFLEQFGFGVCLADDMGLGKTIEFIALLLHERQGETRCGPTLLICPMSVVGNWEKEVARFGPSLKVMVHHGANRLSGRVFEKEARKNDLVISTYALVSRDEEIMSRVQWDYIALDEAQNIKNPSAKQTQAIRKLKAPHRVALTGTPVENRLSELWSIMDFLNPGYLKSAADFRANFTIPIEKYRNPAQAEKLKRLIQPFVLRRVKTDPAVISDLPQKMEMKVFCNLTPEQATLYEAVVREMLEKIENSEGIERKGLVLATLMKLKQVCNHPAHFLQDGSKLPGRSGKLIRLEEMLEEIIAEGDKALVFTQFAEMGALLTKHLEDKFGREILFLHGGTVRKQRDTMVQRFQEERKGPMLFILSLKAGGLGINLTAANHVFHFDRWWNPAVENQATDRAFRIGQTRNVQVHKFVCLGTMEERIDEMIEQKKELAESIVGSGESWLTELSTDRLKEILTLNREAIEEE